MGAWFEAQVVKVTTEPTPSPSDGESSDNIRYHIKYDE